MNIDLTKSKKGGSVFYKILNKNRDGPTSLLKWDSIHNIEAET